MPQVKITDPKTGIKYSLPDGVDATPEVIARVLSHGRRAASSDSSPVSGKRELARFSDGSKMTGEFLPDDGGALARYGRARRGALSALSPASGADLEDWVDTSPELVRRSVDRDSGNLDETERWRGSVNRQAVGALALPSEVGRFGLDAGRLFFQGGASGVDPLELTGRAIKAVVPFAPELEAGASAALEGGGIDLARGGRALGAALKELWDNDPASAIAQAIPVLGGALGGARSAAARALAPESLRVPGAAGPRVYRKAGIEPISGRPLALRRPASARGSSAVGAAGRNPPAWGMPDAAWYRLMKTVEDAAMDSGLSTYEARGATTAYGDLLHGSVPSAAGLANLEKFMGAEAIFLIRAKVGGVRRVRGVKKSTGRAALDKGNTAAVANVADLSGWDGKALGDPSISVSPIDRLKKAHATIIDLMGVPKALKAGYDLSAPGRQGAPMTVYMLLKNPKGYVGAWKDMLKAAEPGDFVGGQGEVNYKAAVKAIVDHGDYGVARKSGLKFSGIDGNEAGHAAGSGARAGFAGGGGGAQKFEIGPISSAAGKLPGLGMSERSFNAFMDRMRMETFSTMKKAAGPGASPADLADIADIVNKGTGYGNPMGWFDEAQKVASGHAENMEKVRKPLESLIRNGMFSANNTAARFQYLNPVRYKRMSPKARKIATEQMVYHALGVGTLMGLAGAMGATVAGANPKGKGVTGDFGKIKAGDTRYEVTGGHARSIRLVLALGQTAIGEGKESEKLAVMRDLLVQFYRNSASPAVGALSDSVFPQYIPQGAPEGVAARAVDLVTPLQAKEFYDAFTQEKGGGVKGLAQVSPSFFGTGVQKYQSTIYGRGKGGSRRGAERSLGGR